MKSSKKFNKKHITNIFIAFYIVLLSVYWFLIGVKIQSSRYLYSNYDQARDTYVSYFINKYHSDPLCPPWGSFRKEYHLKNSTIYYYLLAPFSFTNDGSSLLYFCAFWFSLLIPLVFILTSLISNKYAGVLAATIMFQSTFIGIVSGLPLQPLFTPTILLVFLIFLVLAKKNNSVLCFLISTIILFLGVQVHLSFLRFLVLYFWVFLMLFKKFKANSRFLLILILLVLLGSILFLNTDFFDLYSITNSKIQMVSYNSFKEIFLRELFNGYRIIFGEKLIFFYIYLIFLIKNFRIFKYKFLFLAFLFLAISAIDSETGSYASPYIPFFVVLFSSIILQFKNKFLFIFILFLMVCFGKNRIKFEDFKNLQMMNPVATSQKFLSVIDHDLDPFIKNIPDYCVFRCDSDIVSFNVAYSFYKVQLGQTKKSYYDSTCDDNLSIFNNKKNFLHSFSYNDCKLVFESEKNRKIYNFEKIYSQNGRSVYSIVRKQ